MALIIDPDDLSQGAITTPTDAVWGTPTGREVAITSTALLPDLDANVYFEVRDHPDAENNGLYRVNETNPTTSLITAFKISGVAPIADAVGRTVRIFGTTATAKNVHFDTDARDVYLLEQGLLDGDGVTMQALYSFVKEDLSLLRQNSSNLSTTGTRLIRQFSALTAQLLKVGITLTAAVATILSAIRTPRRIAGSSTASVLVTPSNSRMLSSLPTTARSSFWLSLVLPTKTPRSQPPA
jgi:hypothetical protein